MKDLFLTIFCFASLIIFIFGTGYMYYSMIRDDIREQKRRKKELDKEKDE